MVHGLKEKKKGERRGKGFLFFFFKLFSNSFFFKLSNINQTRNHAFKS
jgi:hypothetical protein